MWLNFVCGGGYFGGIIEGSILVRLRRLFWWNLYDPFVGVVVLWWNTPGSVLVIDSTDSYRSYILIVIS